jgi:hypothetical protein
VQAAVGSVYIATGDASLRRLVFVFGICQPGIAQIALCHSFAELATDQDWILSPALTALPYCLVVQTDIVSPLLASHLHHHLASLPPVLARACYRGAHRAPYPRGLPLQSRYEDARWDYKLQELHDLHTLCAPALARLLD